jgi:chlorosome envelope protein E
MGDFFPTLRWKGTVFFMPITNHSVTMSKISGAFTQWAEAYGRIVEIFTDGHWWVTGDYMENVGKTTKRLLRNAYPYIYGGDSSSAVIRGSSPENGGYANPSKEVDRRFR